MKLDMLQDRLVDAMEAYMTRLSQRQQVVASNLANIDTPGYRTKDVTFHATMQELIAEKDLELRTSRTGHNQGGIQAAAGSRVFEVQGIPARADQNNVDLDREMLKLSETAFAYSLITQLVRSKLGIIATSIHEGKV